MADRNPNIPSERRMDMEDRTEIDEKESQQRYAQQQAKLERENAESPLDDEEAREKKGVGTQETYLGHNKEGGGTNKGAITAEKQ
ncbi:MAG: hypothetical protein OHK0029_13290 [Armatimonadaceae bacterium]